MSFITHQNEQGLVWLTAGVLDGVPHGFSTRLGGVSPAPWDSLNLRTKQGDGTAALRENYRRFFAAVGADERRAVLSRQVHRDDVRAVTEADAGKGLFVPQDYDAADALVTDVPGLPLAVFSADCGTVLLHDPVRGAVGAVHAGWRGCAAGIVEKTVQTMAERFGARPADLRAALGPCIGPCCFETDADVPDALRAALGPEAEACIERRGKKYHIDLAGANRLWLLRAGMLPEHLDLCALCTACRPDLFWSHRKMGEARGVQAAVIARPVPGAAGARP